MSIRLSVNHVLGVTRFSPSLIKIKFNFFCVQIPLIHEHLFCKYCFRYLCMLSSLFCYFHEPKRTWRFFYVFGIDSNISPIQQRERMRYILCHSCGFHRPNPESLHIHCYLFHYWSHYLINIQMTPPILWISWFKVRQPHLCLQALDNLRVLNISLNHQARDCGITCSTSSRRLGSNPNRIIAKNVESCTNGIGGKMRGGRIGPKLAQLITLDI